MKRRIFLLVILLMLINFAGAGEISAQYTQKITNVAQGWAATIVPASIRIFTILWCIETFTQGIFHHLFSFERYRELARFIVVRVCFMSFFTVFLVKPEFYLGIMRFFVELAGYNASTSSMTGIDAGWIWHQFSQWFDNDYTSGLKAVGGATGLANMGQQFLMAFGCVIYFISTLVICFLAIFMQVQAILIVYGALVLTGFAGSKWTIGLWNNYINACISMGIKIMLFCLLYGVLQDVMTYHAGTITGAIDILNQIINCALSTLILVVIPGQIGSMVSGVAASSLGGEIVGAAMAGLALSKTALGTGQSTINNTKSAATNSVNLARSATNAVKSAFDGFKSGWRAGNGSSNNIPQPMADNKDKSEFLKSK